MSFTPDPSEPKRLCQHPQHFPPSHMVFPTPGTWTCPACGLATRVGGSRITYGGNASRPPHGGYPGEMPPTEGEWVELFEDPRWEASRADSSRVTAALP